MNENLPIYGVPENVSQFCTEKKDIKKGEEKQPPEAYRLRNEDQFDPIREEENKENILDDLPDLSSGEHRPTFVKQGLDANATLSDFEIKSVIGRGSFGKVFLVQKRGTT